MAQNELFRVMLYKYKGNPDTPVSDLALEDFDITDIVEVQRTEEQWREAFRAMLKVLDSQSE